MVSHVELNIDRSLLDANFEGYKVDMTKREFENQKFEGKIFTRIRPNSMVTLQHMKIFANQNVLFYDSAKSDNDTNHLYSILETGQILRMSYNSRTFVWKTSLPASIPIGSTCDVAYPPNILFTERNLVVVCDGLNSIWVFLVVSEDNWVEMLQYTVFDSVAGCCLIEARVLDDGQLHLAVQRVEECQGALKYCNRIVWVTVGLDDIDTAERLLVLKRAEFLQDGHFETCTWGFQNSLVFLSSKKPRLEGAPVELDEDEISRNWEQSDEIIKVTFNLNCEISKEDVKLNATRRAIFLAVRDKVLLQGTLGGEIDDESIEIGLNQNENALIVMFKSVGSGKWGELVEEKAKKGFGEMGEDELCGVDEESEECDVSESRLALYWMQSDGELLQRCDVSNRQVLFVRRSCVSPTVVCFRHDVDGVLCSFDASAPTHVASLLAFGYVQASKTMRSWSGCSPDYSIACISESNNRVLVYSQCVAVEGSLVNRKTSSKVSHVAKQMVLRVNASSAICGVVATNGRIFALTENHIHVLNL